MTHRQFLTWLAWLGEQWNQPSRSDYYAMRVAFRCHQVLLATLNKDASKATEEEQRVKFVSKSEKERALEAEIKPLSDETRLRMQKAEWRHRMGKPVKTTPPSKEK